jgi:hypothetical protein
MIIAFSSDPNSDFAVLLLVPLLPGQDISATDADWRTDVSPNAFHDYDYGFYDYGFYDYEKHTKYTATIEEAAGTKLTMSNFDDVMYLSSSADQLLVYRGAQASPTFLCAFDNSRGSSSSLATQYCPGSTGGWGQAVSVIPPTI